MSDALTDFARQQKQTDLYNNYLHLLEDYINDPTNNKRQKVIKSVKEMSIVKISESGKYIKKSEEIQKFIDSLLKKDKNTWSQFLFTLRNDDIFFEKFKRISPFSDTFIIMADYGHGFVSFYGDLENLIRKMIEDKGLPTYKAGDYLISFENINTEKAEVLNLE